MSWIVNFAEKTTSFASKIAQRVKQDHKNYRSTQNEYDTRRVYSVLEKYATKRGLNLEKLNEDEFSNIRLMKRNIKDRIKLQTFKLFEECFNTGGSDPFPSPILPICLQEGKTYEELAEERLDLLTEDEVRKKKDVPLRSKPIKHPDGFNLEIKYSSIEHAESGFGVWIDGKGEEGTIIGFYPGIVYYPNQINPKLVEGNEYLISRYDGIVIDGKHWSDQSIKIRRKFKQLQNFHPIVMKNLEKGEGNFDEISKYRNPFGIGNYINHPPPKVLPNVLCYAFDLKFQDYPEEFFQYFPYKYVNESRSSSILYPDDGEVAFRALIVILTKNVENEELYLNYRFNPSNPYPPWYFQPDLEEAKRRWGKIGFLSNLF